MKTHLITTISIMLAAIMPGQHAGAASSNWQDLGGGEARLIARLDPETNEVEGAVEVRLQPGWSTYWRNPGSSGIPPTFDFSRSQGFLPGKVEFPAPTLLEYESGDYAGYKRQVLFPFEGTMAPGTPGAIQLDLLIGVCSEICIPAKAELNIRSGQLLQSDPVASQKIQLAKLRVPKHREPEETVLEVRQSGGDSLQITMAHKASHGKPQLFVEGPDEWYLQPAKLIRQSENEAFFELDVSRAPDGTDVLSEKLRYTLVTGHQGIETVR